VKELYHKFIGY